MLGTHQNKNLLKKKDSKTCQQRDTFLDGVLLDKREAMDGQVFTPSGNPSISSQMSRPPEDSGRRVSPPRNMSHSGSKEASFKRSEDKEEVIAQSNPNEESLQMSPSLHREG